MVTRSGVKVGVNVRVQGQGSGQGLTWGGGQCLADLGQMVGGERLEINCLFLSRTHDSIPFQSNPFHSIPFHIPFHSNPFHSIPCFTQCPFLPGLRKNADLMVNSECNT